MPLKFADEGVLKRVEIGAEHLRGTLFEQVAQVLNPGEKLSVRAGKYGMFFIWFDVLKLRLHKDWVEPAHFRKPEVDQVLQQLRRLLER